MQSKHACSTIRDRAGPQLTKPNRIIVPRIVFEAVRLIMRRGLHQWHRPEPKLQTVPRRATSSEKLVHQKHIWPH